MMITFLNIYAQGIIIRDKPIETGNNLYAHKFIYSELINRKMSQHHTLVCGK